MAEATITLKANADQAQREVRELGDTFVELDRDVREAGSKGSASLTSLEASAAKADRALDRMGRSGKSMGVDIGTAASVATAAMHGMSLAFGAVRGGTELAKRSMEGFFRQSEEGEELFERLRVKWGQLLGKLVELALGTTDVDEAFQKLSDAIDYATQTADWFITAFRDVTAVLGNVTGLGRVVRGAFNMMGSAMRNARQEAAITATEIGESFGRLSDETVALASATAEYQLEASRLTLERTAEEAAGLILATAGIAEGTREWRANHADLVDSVIAGEDAFRLERISISESMDRAAHHSSQMIELGGSLRSAGDDGYMMAAALDEAGRRAQDAQARIEGLDTALEESSARPSGAGVSAMTEEIDTVAQAIEASRQAGLDFLSGPMAQAMDDEADRWRAVEDARRSAASALEDESSRSAIAIEEQAIRTAELAVIEEQREEDRSAGNRAAAEAHASFAQSSLASIAAMIAGEEGAKAAFFKSIGQKLMAEGSSAVFKGGIEVAFGNPQGFAGISAGLAALAAGQTIMSGQAPGGGSESSAVASGAAAPAVAQPAPAQGGGSIEIVNNFGIAQDPRYAATAVADAFNYANRLGMVDR